MKTYTNYYSIEQTEAGSKHLQLSKYQLRTIARDRLDPALRLAFNIPNIAQADLQEEAKQYILECGLSQEELDSLILHLK